MKLLAEWFWIDRWDGSRAPLLSMEAQGIYRAMLSQAWRRGASLPADEEEIQLLIRVRPKEWRRSWPAVKPFWLPGPDGTIYNQTQVEVYAEALGKAQRAQARAQAGAQARHKKVPEVLLKTCPPSPSPSPRINGSTTAPPSPRAKAETREALRAAITELSMIVGRDFDRVAEAVTSGKARTGKRQCQPCINLDRISEDQAKRSILDANTLIEQAKAEA